MTKVKNRDHRKQKAANVVKLDAGHATSPTMGAETENIQLQSDPAPVGRKRQKRYGHN